VTPADPGKALLGAFWGRKAGSKPGCRWASILAVGGQLLFHRSSRYSADMKFGYAPASWLAFGPELAAFGDEEDASGRAGGFVRIKAAGMETRSRRRLRCL